MNNNIDNILSKILKLYDENKRNDSCNSIYKNRRRLSGIFLERYVDYSIIEPNRKTSSTSSIWAFFVFSCCLILPIVSFTLYYGLLIDRSMFFPLVFCFSIFLIWPVGILIDSIYLLCKIKSQRNSGKDTIYSLINQIDFSLSNKKMLEEKMTTNPILAEIFDKKYAKKIWFPYAIVFFKIDYFERTNTIDAPKRFLYMMLFANFLFAIVFNGVFWLIFLIVYKNLTPILYLVFVIIGIVGLYLIVCFIISVIATNKLRKAKVNFIKLKDRFSRRKINDIVYQ